MNCPAVLMQTPAYISLNSSEILAREPVRSDLQKKVVDFLKANTITVLGTRTVQSKKTQMFNTVIAVAPKKQQQVARAKERLEAEVRALAVITIEGVEMLRSAHEIAQIMRSNGHNLRGPSVERIAASIGQELAS